MKAVETVQEAGAEVALVFTMVDRQEGAAEAIAAAGHRFRALFSAEEFLRRG
jgi:orotate phosphoribosyltransferase